MKTNRLLLLLLVPSLAGIALAAPPANDDFADRTVISESSLPVRIPFDNTEATTEANEPGDPEFQKASVWYSVTLSGGSSYQIDTYFSDKDFELEVYTGTSIGALTLDDSDDEDDCTNFACGSSVIVRPPVETTYQIRIVSPVFESGVQSGAGSINITEFAPSADHDDFADALPVAVGGSGRVSYLGDGDSITYEPGEETLPGASGNLWFSFTPDVSAAYAFTTGTDEHYLFEGTALDNIASLIFGPLRSGHVIELNGGQTYYIAVYPGSSVLPQSLIIEGPLEPAQSPGSPPIDLGAAQRYEADISLREGDGVGDDFFWFENWHWTPGSNGTVTIDVAGILSNPSSFSVYRGTTVTPANLLEEIEFKGGTIELAVTAGQTYTLVGIVRIDEERVASGSMSVDLSFESSGGGVALAPVDVRLVNSNGALSIEWTPDPKTAAGSRYEVQFSGDLRSPWTPIGSDISANSFDLGAIVSPSGFYRIVASTP